MLLGAALLMELSGCGGSSGGTREGAYRRVNLSMSVNGTDTQIDSLAANHFAQLVAERSEGNVIILGGIYGGIFTPTEAAAVSVFYGLIAGIFVYKEIDFKKTIDILIDSCSTTATVMFITMGAPLFAPWRWSWGSTPSTWAWS